MHRLVAPNADEAAAVDARQELDLKVGVAFTRFQSRYFGGRYRERMRVISYGPVRAAINHRICLCCVPSYWRYVSTAMLAMRSI